MKLLLQARRSLKEDGRAVGPGGKVLIHSVRAEMAKNTSLPADPR